MPITITETQKKKLLGTIRQILPDIKIQNNYLILRDVFKNFESIDDVISIDSPQRKILTATISDKPLSKFFSFWIVKEFWDREYDEDVGLVSLKDLSDIATFEQIATEMVNDFLALPHSYKLLYPLPEAIHALLRKDLQEFQFGDSVRLTRWSPKLAGNYSEVYRHEGELTKNTIILPDIKAVDRNEAGVVLEVDMSGYFDFYNELNSAHDASGIVRSFLGLCFANKIVKHTKYDEKKSSSIIFRYKYELSALNYDGFSLIGGTVYSAIGNLFVNISVSGNDKLYNLSMNRMRNALRSKTSEKILLASRWLFDSLTGDNDLLSFIQATICIEILLGDQKHADQLSIGDILSNRCAYMIGRNEIEREIILKDFKNIYSVRSEIVHRGKARLLSEDIEQFNKLMSYAGRVIVKEIDLLSEPIAS